MEEIVVTRLWMGGVVAMMVVFAAIAVIGNLRQQSGSKPAADQDKAED